ncbi:MAG: pseudoazurin [Methylophaga sp.]|nr:MAG: pseudoazurin [Methylophaga sp.]
MNKLKLSILVLATSLFYHGVALSAEHTVKMLNNGADGMMVFEPAFLKAEKGDTVTFESTDAGHDSVSLFIPEGATAWTGENSKDITVTLDAEGVYIYKCTPHVMMAMVGVIQVGEASNKTGAEAAAEELSSKIMMNKDRLGGYIAKIM